MLIYKRTNGLLAYLRVVGDLKNVLLHTILGDLDKEYLNIHICLSHYMKVYTKIYYLSTFAYKVYKTDLAVK